MPEHLLGRRRERGARLERVIGDLPPPTTKPAITTELLLVLLVLLAPLQQGTTEVKEELIPEHTEEHNNKLLDRKRERLRVLDQWVVLVKEPALLA